MCGICGYIDYDDINREDILQEMVATLRHRGPDDQGIFVDRKGTAEVGLGQTRLSILDLSEKGHQPMHFEPFTIVFNGEIYNYLEIKKELIVLGHHFISNTDTEVVLHAHAEWGQRAVQLFIGMFSYILFDRNEHKITAYRDRAGVKPFYYYFSEELLLFSSELKAFHQHPRFVKDIDPSSLTLFFKLGYIPAPHCIFKNVFKLEAGHFIDYNINNKKLAVHQYWNILEFYEKPKLNVNYKEAKTEVEKLLKSACEYRMISDVPVGVFLSGGYDSSVVTALLQHERTEKLKTFTIGFDKGLNEAPFAKNIAKHLHTDHTEMICTAKDAEQIIPELPYYFDEPFADVSAIPTMLVSRLAKKQVTVALSADGGDEVFAGYQHYETISKYLSQIDTIPLVLRGSTKVIAKGLINILPEKFVGLQHRLKAFAATVDLEKKQQVGAIYEEMSYLPAVYIKKLLKTSKNIHAAGFRNDFSNFTETTSIAPAIDYINFLQNDILTKVDRATMSVGLEGREPFLDHRLIEYVAQLPPCYKNDGITAKRILKDIAHQYVPKDLLNRPKTGFDPPIYQWLKTDCAALVEHYFSETAVRKSGLLNEEFVTQIKLAFFADKLHYSQLVWRTLMFQLWFEKWK